MDDGFGVDAAVRHVLSGILRVLPGSVLPSASCLCVVPTGQLGLSVFLVTVALRCVFTCRPRRVDEFWVNTSRVP